MGDYIKVVYNEVNKPYSDYPGQLCRWLFDRFEMKTRMKFLEAGCGRGEFLKGFAGLGLDACGLDISAEAANYSAPIPVVVCDMDNQPMPFADNTFDVVYSKSLLEHFFRPERYLTEAFRVLKPGGKLLTLVPDWESNYKTYFDDYTHRTPFTAPALQDIYRIHDYSEVEVFKFRQLPVVWKYPVLNSFCAVISPFIPARTKNKFLRWSRELMLVGYGIKPAVRK
ncbi:MAG: methyltransferase [Elusimicrobia bacterium GWC2_51_8]|nr:MAG: methyltransferase [Elusimicrobia bacterium GWA2_51_34]OGR59356.1 MAG: methyltransferase [Elusimicrobia bacterium GWC2_51_8]OGR86986.1 MAG: methyltransferase [Elusimicrobia bacterium GWF2_52_66]HAF96561.1 methyltransferase [Elusimicrobiota bacterium]HCE98213.1 methyltransferase [Elusimicrobiota bacterium]